MTNLNSNHKATKKTGAFMLIAGWLGALFLVGWLFSDILYKRENPNSHIVTHAGNNGVSNDANSTPRKLDLIRNPTGHYVVNGLINDKEVTFFVDTGATTVAIPGHIAVNVGLKKGYPIKIQTASDIITGYHTIIDELKIGGITVNKVRATIIPETPDDKILLGMSVLGKLELIQRGRTLTIIQK